MHRRTESKAIYPGYWDVAAGGMVQADESFAESAARELEEELGVGGVELTAHECFFFDQPGNRLWCAVFSAVWDGPLRLQPEEVSEARFIPSNRPWPTAGNSRIAPIPWRRCSATSTVGPEVANPVQIGAVLYLASAQIIVTLRGLLRLPYPGCGSCAAPARVGLRGRYPARGADQFLSSPYEDQKWPKKPHHSPPSVAWCSPLMQAGIARTAANP
ncbi:putative Nudix hydrolase YfcD [compost metagenome]